MTSKKITFLGTGTPDAIKYFNSCFYIKEGDTGLLVDTGGGSQILSQLEKANISLEEIKHIYITHKHIDHIFGLFWILRFLGSKISKGEAKGLTIFCSQNTADLIKQISFIFLKRKVTDLFEQKIIFDILEDGKEIKISDWKIKCFDIHSDKEEQYGFRIEFLDKTSFVCSGDEPYKDIIFERVNNADYLLHDAFCLDRDRDIFEPYKINHSTAKSAGENAAKINAKSLILFHTEDKSTFGERKKIYQKEAEKYFKGKIFVPDDLEVIELQG